MATNSSKKEKQPAVPARPERFIYCGPNIPGGSLPRYTVYKGGLPAHLDGLFSQCPAVKALFVPVADLARTEGAIASKGTPENLRWQSVVQFIQKGGSN